MPRMTDSALSRKHLIIVLIALILAIGFLLIRAERAEAALCGVASDPGSHNLSSRDESESSLLATSLCDGAALVGHDRTDESGLMSVQTRAASYDISSPVGGNGLLAQISNEEYAEALTLERLLLLGMLGLVVLTWIYLKWRPPNDSEDEYPASSDHE